MLVADIATSIESAPITSKRIHVPDYVVTVQVSTFMKTTIPLVAQFRTMNRALSLTGTLQPRQAFQTFYILAYTQASTSHCKIITLSLTSCSAIHSTIICTCKPHPSIGHMMSLQFGHLSMHFSRVKPPGLYYSKVLTKGAYI